MKKILSIMIVSLLVFACTSVCLLVLADTGLQESGEPSAETLSAETFSAEISVAPKTTLTTEEVLAAIERAEAMVEDPSLGGTVSIYRETYSAYLEEVVNLAYAQLTQGMREDFYGALRPYTVYMSLNCYDDSRFILSSNLTNYSGEEIVFPQFYSYWPRPESPNVQENTVLFIFNRDDIWIKNSGGESLYPTAEQEAFLNSLPYEMCYDLDPNGIPRGFQDYLLSLSPEEREAYLSVSREVE